MQHWLAHDRYVLFKEYFVRCSVAEDFSGAEVECLFEGLGRPGRQRVEVGLLGEVLAHEAVQVSIEPRCQGELGSLKKMGMPRRRSSWAWRWNSWPLSLVMVLVFSR